MRKKAQARREVKELDSKEPGVWCVGPRVVAFCWLETPKTVKSWKGQREEAAARTARTPQLSGSQALNMPLPLARSLLSDRPMSD